MSAAKAQECDCSSSAQRHYGPQRVRDTGIGYAVIAFSAVAAEA
jgi:hypothetical protein